MANQKYNTIKVVLRDLPFEREYPLGDQGYDDPITPGMLVEVSTTGCLPLKTATTKPSPCRVATEMGLDGRGIDADYTEEGEAVVVNIFLPGEQFYGLLEVGANVAADALLEPNGAGCLQAGAACFRAMQAVNNSAGSKPARILVEVL